MVVTCAMYGCLSSSRHDKDRSFFHFPKDAVRSREWVRATGRLELMSKGVATLNKSYLICDLHFNASDRLVKKLKVNAVPTVTLPILENKHLTKSTQTEVPIIFTSDSATQTIDNFIICEIPNILSATETTQVLTEGSHRKRKLLKKKIKCNKRRLIDDDQASTSTQLQKFIDVQNQLKNNSRGNRYDSEFKFFALSIYFASPLAYRVLAKTLNFPSERTLRRINVNTGTKVSPCLLSCLEAKIKIMKESERYCTICADVMSLKLFLYYEMNTDKIIGFHEIDGEQTAEPATQAFVVLARGLFFNWKQPLGYCFLANSQNYKDLNTWLDDIITNICNIGLRVVAFVSDQRPIFLNSARERNVSIDKPYFFINGKKIFYIFDVPHLMKSLRNNLMKYDFEFNGVDGVRMLATWKSIESFYRADSKREYRLAPKLTESHINPNNIEKTNVKYAIQVFSKTVATAMNCSIEFGQLENISIGTVKFIELINNNFDILNSSPVSDPYAYKKAYAAYQIEMKHRFLQFLSDVIVRDKTTNKDITNSIKCLKGFQISIKSITELTEDLESKDLRLIFTRRLNKDALENLFVSVRKQNGNCREPTPVQFSRAFRKLFVVNMLKHSENACTAVVSNILDNLPNLGNPTVQTILPTLISVATVDYRFNLPDENAFAYVCGYLLKKCHNMHKCDSIDSYIQTINDINTEDDKTFVQNSLLLINPPNTFVALIQKMDDCFKLFFQNKILNCIGNEILKSMQDITFDCCCPCFPIDYLKKLFVRFRIFNIVRFNNRHFIDKSFKRKYFSVSNI